MPLFIDKQAPHPLPDIVKTIIWVARDIPRTPAVPELFAVTRQYERWLEQIEDALSHEKYLGIRDLLIDVKKFTAYLLWKCQREKYLFARFSSAPVSDFFHAVKFHAWNKAPRWIVDNRTLEELADDILKKVGVKRITECNEMKEMGVGKSSVSPGKSFVE